MPRPRISGRRDRILDVAEALILDVGFAGMTMGALAERVGIGKGALYLEFAGKSEIVDHLLARSTTRAVAAVDARLSPDAGLGELYRAAAESLLEDRLLTAAYLDDAGVLGDYVAEHSHDARYRRRLDAFAGYVDLLRRRGRIDPDLDPDALAVALAAFTVGLLSMTRVVGPLPPELLGAAIRTVGTIVDRGVVGGPADSSPDSSPDGESTPGDDDIRAAYRGMVERMLADNARPAPDDEPPTRRTPR